MISLTISACLYVNNSSFIQIDKFKKDISAEYKQIKIVDFEFTVPCFQFSYSFLDKTTEEEVFGIFDKTKTFIQSADFQTDFFKEYFKKYFTEQKIYPSAKICFDLNSDGKYEYVFDSMYYKQPYNSAANNEIDGYKTWDYSHLNSESKPVPER